MLKYILLFVISINLLAEEYQINKFTFPGINRHFKVENETIVLASLISGPTPVYRNMLYYSLNAGKSFDSIMLDRKDLINEVDKEWHDFLNISILDEFAFCAFDNGILVKVHLNNKSLDTINLNLQNKKYKEANFSIYQDIIMVEFDNDIICISEDSGTKFYHKNISYLLSDHNPESKNALQSIHQFNEKEILLSTIYYGQGRRSFHYSEDFGETWEHHHYNNTSSVWTSFLNPDLGISHGFVNRVDTLENYSLRPVIHRVTNKGSNFEEVMVDEDEFGPIKSSVMLNENEWWAVNGVKIYYTKDGGDTWDFINKFEYDDFQLMVFS
jgi:hypothetical protein